MDAQKIVDMLADDHANVKDPSCYCDVEKGLLDWLLAMASECLLHRRAAQERYDAGECDCRDLAHAMSESDRLLAEVQG